MDKKLLRQLQKGWDNAWPTIIFTFGMILFWFLTGVLFVVGFTHLSNIALGASFICSMTGFVIMASFCERIGRQIK